MPLRRKPKEHDDSLKAEVWPGMAARPNRLMIFSCWNCKGSFYTTMYANPEAPKQVSSGNAYGESLCSLCLEAADISELGTLCYVRGKT